MARRRRRQTQRDEGGFWRLLGTLLRPPELFAPELPALPRPYHRRPGSAPIPRDRYLKLLEARKEAREAREQARVEARAQRRDAARAERVARQERSAQMRAERAERARQERHERQEARRRPHAPTRAEGGTLTAAIQRLAAKGGQRTKDEDRQLQELIARFQRNPTTPARQDAAWLLHRLRANPGPARSAALDHLARHHGAYGEAKLLAVEYEKPDGSQWRHESGDRGAGVPPAKGVDRLVIGNDGTPRIEGPMTWVKGRGLVG